MSTTLGKRHAQMVAANGLRNAVMRCVIDYDKAHNSGDPRLITPALINATLVSVVGETVALVLGIERCSQYQSQPLWRQRLNYRARTFIAAAWIARCAFLSAVKSAEDVGLRLEADASWLNGIAGTADKPHQAAFH